MPPRHEPERGTLTHSAMYAPVTLVATVLLASLTCAPAAQAQFETDRFGTSLHPGHEEEIVALLSPHSAEDFRCAGWRLTSMRAGPDCAVRLVMGPDDASGGAELTVALAPRLTADTPGTKSITVAVEPAGPGSPQQEALLRCLIDTVAPNDPGGFFTEKCAVTRSDASSESESEAHQGEEAPEPTPWGGILRLLLFAAAAGGALWLLRKPRPAQRDQAAPPTQSPGDVPTLSRGARWGLALLMGGALLVRARAMTVLGPGLLELDSFGYGEPFEALLRQCCLLSTDGSCELMGAFHPPLWRTLLDPWLLLGDQLAVGGELLWVRLPGLASSAWLIWLLVRLGRVVDAPLAGWGAALLAAFLPEMIRLSCVQGPYFLELVLVVWFLERLLTYVLLRRPVHRSLSVAAIASPWVGHLSLLVVGPGALAFLAVALRRGQRRQALASLLLMAGLYAPIAGGVVQQAVDYASVSVDSEIGATADAVLAARTGHEALNSDALGDPALSTMTTFPVTVGRRLLGTATAWVALVGALWFAVRRPRLGWYPLLVTASLAAVAASVYTRWINFTALLPLFLFVPLWAITLLPRLGGERATRIARRATCVLFVALSLLVGSAEALERSPLESAGELTGWLVGGDDAEVMIAPVHADGQAAVTPVVLLSARVDNWYLLCRERDTVADYRTCETARVAERWEPDTALALFDLGPRRVARFDIRHFRSGAARGRCPEPERLLATAPWSGGHRFVVVEDEFAALVESECAERWLPAACALQRTAPGLRLYECNEPGHGSVNGGGDAPRPNEHAE